MCPVWNRRRSLWLSPQVRLSSGKGAQSQVSQSSHHHVTVSPSTQPNEVTSSSLHSRRHSRNRAIFPGRDMWGSISTSPSTSLWAAPRVRVPPGAIVQQTEEEEVKSRPPTRPSGRWGETPRVKISAKENTFMSLRVVTGPKSIYLISHPLKQWSQTQVACGPHEGDGESWWAAQKI